MNLTSKLPDPGVKSTNFMSAKLFLFSTSERHIVDFPLTTAATSNSVPDTDNPSNDGLKT